MLKIVTVFSDIGALEQAIKRLGIDYKIVFTCDNGARAIDIDYDLEMKKIIQLNVEWNF